VEIKAATATGTSNPILVLVAPSAPAGTQKALVSFTVPSLTIAFNYKNLGIVAVSDPPNLRPPVIAISVADKTVTLNDKDKVNVVFKADDGTTVTVSGVTYNGTTNQLEGFGPTLMQQVLTAYGAVFGPENSNPPVPIKLTASFRDTAGNPATVGGGLTIQWIHIPETTSK
jgi:hypothetical protein